MKTDMAKAVLKDFPGLNSGNILQGGYDAFFTPCRTVEKFGETKRVSATGYIEERLKTLRVKLSPSKKAHKKHVFRSLVRYDETEDAQLNISDFFDIGVTSKIRRLQHEHLDDDAIDVIMEETFEARKAWIWSKCPPTRTIFANFPPLKHILSCHVIKEFARLQPDAKDFVDAWEQMAPIVIAYAHKKTDNLNVSSLLDEMNRGGQGRSAEAGYKPQSYVIQEYASYLLPYVIRPPVRKKSRFSGTEAAQSFIKPITNGTPVETLCESTGPPTVVVMGARGDISQSFVLIEGNATSMPSLLSAIDLAFKLHYLFNIAYNPKSEHLWQFLQKIVYNIQDQTTTFSLVYDFQAFMKDRKRHADDL